MLFIEFKELKLIRPERKILTADSWKKAVALKRYKKEALEGAIAGGYPMTNRGNCFKYFPCDLLTIWGGEQPLWGDGVKTNGNGSSFNVICFSVSRLFLIKQPAQT